MPAPLHVHSWYSLLEGTASPEALLERAAACGYTSLALTDTNNLYGAVAFAQQTQSHGIRPLLGACLRQNRTRCVALVADAAGYSSLCRILSRLHLFGPARLETFDPKTIEPVSLADLLAENSTGLHLLVEDRVLAERLRAIYGRRLWLEVVRPARSAHQEQELLAWGRQLGLEPVASTAAHLARPEEYDAFRVATAVGRGVLLDQLPERLSITPAHHLVDQQTLKERFRDLPEAVRNTDVLAERLECNVVPNQLVLPPIRARDPARLLRHLCEQGLLRRGLGESPQARQRLRQELAVIEGRQLTGYFLVVCGIARYARRQNYGMALRGSAGNSLVCFLLEITDVDPLRFDLPFERFLHPGRADLPDIDLDFDWKVRDNVLAHVFRHYGPKRTAMISSHLFLQPRSAFREAAKLHGLSNEQVSILLETLAERVTSLLAAPEESGVSPAGKTSGPSWEAPRRFPLEPERWPRILADARRLLGRPHHLSVHPGGVVITPEPTENYVPLQRAPKGVIITQFEKDAAEQIGLVKIDLLGNRALANIRQVSGHFLAAPNSPETFLMLRRGDTLGVNQLESPAMRHLLIQMQPRRLEDVIQALALIRPGAASVGAKESFIRRRRGLEPVRCPHPLLEPVLGDTEGLMLYEDDALRVLEVLTGLPAADADQFRKRVVKHRTEEEARALTEEFLRACAGNGVPGSVAAQLWVQIAKFNRYSFCKSHAVSYGLIAWQAAAFKVHDPLHFWTSALNNNQGMYPRRVYIEAIKRAGIPLRPPCINRSVEEFAVDEEGIRVGLQAVGSLGEELCAALLADRARRGPYRDLADFRRRLHPGPETLALLIRCGVLDFTGQSRPALFLEADLQDHASSWGSDAAGRLFPDDPRPGWSPADYDLNHRLRAEWEILGFILGPRLLSLFHSWLPPGLTTSRELPDHIGRRVRVAGVVATARHTPTADGRDMQFVTLEDECGLIDVTLFPGTCPLVAYLTLGPYVASGTVEEQYGVVTVTARSFERVDRLAGTRGMALQA